MPLRCRQTAEGGGGCPHGKCGHHGDGKHRGTVGSAWKCVRDDGVGDRADQCGREKGRVLRRADSGAEGQKGKELGRREESAREGGMRFGHQWRFSRVSACSVHYAALMADHWYLEAVARKRDPFAFAYSRSIWPRWAAASCS